MFEQGTLDALFERRCPAVTPESAALVERIADSARQENRAAAARLAAIADLFDARMATARSDADQYVADTVAAVAAEVSAALTIGHGAACAQVGLARDLHRRLPQVAAVFGTGVIDVRLVETLVTRTALVVDPWTLVRIDTALAAATARLTTMTYGALLRYVDRIVGRWDPDAVRRRTPRTDRRDVWVTDHLDGMSDFGGTAHSPTVHAFYDRLTALAATVCDCDPRTVDQRRGDALEAVATGADRLACHCGTSDCPAGGLTAAPVVLHILTDHTASAHRTPEVAAMSGAGTGMGVLVGAEGMLPAELIDQLAATARVRPVVHPGDDAPEPGYTPSAALADYLRWRDLTCRFPGCAHPALRTDIDHTIPYAAGGPTQASNLKCLCRLHHLIKTFGGWTDQQLPDGTIIWTSPAGHTYITTPGSALLFPTLCTPTAPVARGQSSDTPETGGADRLARAPRRRRTRAQHRTATIAAQRAHNHHTRNQHRQRLHPRLPPTAPPSPDDEPPPF